MDELIIIGLDLAKRSFQLHGARQDGVVLFHKKISREKLLAFLSEQPKAIVAMEACASAHYWGRQIGALGHETRLIPPIYVKPFVKRQKNDAADAEAIAEAASRPTMRFVAVKSAEQQADGMLFRVRDLYVRQRTQTINALRGHLAEFGLIAPAGGHGRVDQLELLLEETTGDPPEAAKELARLLLDQVKILSEKISALEKQLRSDAPRDPERARLMTIPGVGPICASAVRAFAPAMEAFRSGRDFAAWTGPFVNSLREFQRGARVGLTPRQNSTGGKTRLRDPIEICFANLRWEPVGRISKMGQNDIRRLLEGSH